MPLFAAFRGAAGPAVAVVDLGPNDGLWIEGFTPESEIEDGVSHHWTRHTASLDLPLWASGRGIELMYRYARILPQTAIVYVTLNGRLIDSFRCRGGASETRRVQLDLSERSPVVVSLFIDSHDRRDLGLRMDWFGVRIGARGRMGLRAWPRTGLVLLLVVAYLALRLGALTARAALGIMAPLAVALAFWIHADPLAVARVTYKMLPSTPIVLGLAAAWLRRRHGGRWILAVIAVSYLLKGAGLFHPQSCYPDVEMHRRFAFEIAKIEGSFFERVHGAQKNMGWAYRVVDGGLGCNLPYSSLFYMPFVPITSLGAETVEDAMRHVGLAATVLEIALVFWLAGMLFDSRAGVAAAILAASLPVVHSRLLYAMWPTLVGHVIDLAVVAMALRYLLRPEPWRLAGLHAFAVAACLMYVSSIFTVSLFLGILALLDRRRLVPLLTAAVTAVVITLVALYWSFIDVFFRDILPVILRAGAAAARGDSPMTTLSRIPLFFGWAYPPLAAGGLMLAWRRAPAPAFKVLAAGILTYVGLLSLRACGGSIFKDLKETTFVAPFVAITAGALIAELATMKSWGRSAAGLVIAGLVFFGLGGYCEYLQAHFSYSMNRNVDDPRLSPNSALP
ncbi:MAG: hypothetical protein JXO72_04270 [Vicinamibacteria bacterium]|nr:hypothetical protein [Vicinamibacteria bacterium]